jgi:putative transposase
LSWTGSKKNLDYPIDALRTLIDPDNSEISIARQCELLGLSRSSYYYDAAPVSAEDLDMMRRLDELYMEHPFLGSRRMAEKIGRQLNCDINRKRMQRLMRLMGIQAIYPKPNLSKADADHKIYPYLLRNVAAKHPNHVWSCDITYVPLEGGFAYLVAVIDWYSRLVLSWRLSNTMTADFCIEALEAALSLGKPLIFNTDQGSQFTCNDFTKILIDSGIAVSMDGKGRALDNIFIERLWRSVKYEDIYIRGYQRMPDANAGLARYFDFYNVERPHQSLDYLTPKEVHYAS